MPPQTLPLAVSAVVFSNRYPGRRLKLVAGRTPLLAEVAVTPEEVARGLSGRTSLRDGEGMLFVMRSVGHHPFWMRGTFVPLSIAFLGDDGEIEEIRDMRPHSEERIAPSSPTRLALEVPQGWFTRRGVSVGDKVLIDK